MRPPPEPPNILAGVAARRRGRLGNSLDASAPRCPDLNFRVVILLYLPQPELLPPAGSLYVLVRRKQRTTYAKPGTMPKGPKSVGQLCAELGMDAVAELNFRKECQAFLKDHITDVPNANDEFVEAAALKFLNSGAGSKHFSWDSALVSQVRS